MSGTIEQTQPSGVEGTYLIPQALRALRLVWQGRVTVVPKRTRAGLVLSHHVDDKPATAGVDMDLYLLDRDGYVEHAPLLVGDEWAVVRTTDLGEASLTFNGADTGRFEDR